MPKDLTAPSQNWNIQDQINQSQPINQENKKSLDDYKLKTESLKNIDSILTDYENQGIDTTPYRAKLDVKSKEMELSFGDKLGVVGRNIGNAYSNFIPGMGRLYDTYVKGEEFKPLEKTNSEKWGEALQSREQVINPISTIATEVALDPLTWINPTLASVGKSGVRAAKDFAKGAGVSAGSYTAKEIGSDNFNPEDALIAGAFGGAINAGIGKYLSKGIKGDLLNPDVTNAYNITNKILSEGGVPYTKDAKLSEYIKNKIPTEKIVEDSSPITNKTFQQNTIKNNDNNSSDSIAKKMNDMYFGGKNIIPETVPVRSDMPKVDNSIDSNKVNDFFNPVDTNKVQAQGDAKLPTPASQQDPFVYTPKNQVDTFGFEKDAQRNNKLQQLKEKISPLNDVLKTNETNSLMGVKRENPNDISLPPISEQKSILPDVLPTDKQELMDVIRYAKDNNAVDEFISKLPPNSRVDEVKQFFDNLKPAQPKEDNVLPKINNVEPRQTNSGILYSNGGQTVAGGFGGGAESEFSQRDNNNDGKHDYKDTVIGALIGAVGISAARKILPSAFRDKNIDSNTIGMFVGKNPTDTVRIENQGKYKIPLSQDVQDLSKIKTNELNFKEFNNPNAKHQEQGIVDSKSLKRHIDKILQNPNIYAKGTQKDSSLVALRKNGTDDIVVANSNNGNVISGFKNTDEKYMDKIIEKSMGGRPSSTVLHQGVDSTASSLDEYNAVPHSLDKSISNNISKSQDIKLNASPTVSGGMVGGVAGANNDLNGDGKTDLKDILIGVGLGAGGTKGVILAKNNQKFTKVVEDIKSNQNVNAIYGFNIKNSKDYLQLRENVMKATNQKMEQFSLLHEQLKLLPENDKKAMYEYMSGNKNINIDKDAKQLADNYTNEINKMGKELVNLGTLEQAQYDKFEGRYLHRSYEKDLSQKFNSLFTKGKTIQGVHARGNEWSGTKAEYEDLLSKGDIGDFFSGKIEATKMSNGQYKFRQDWTEEQRTRWGEVKDIAFSLPETLMRTSEMVNHAKFLKEVIDKTQYVADESMQGYTQLVGKKYGALQGKYVRNDIAQDISEFNEALFGKQSDSFTDNFAEGFKTTLTYWKKTHTVYNGVAHFNNLATNVILQFGAGINPHTAVANAKRGYTASGKVGMMRQLEAKKIIGLSKEEIDKLNILTNDEDVMLWKQAKEAGVFGRSRLNDVLNKYVVPTSNSSSFSKMGGLKKIDEKLSSMYQGEDDIMRFSVLKSLTDKGMSFDAATKKISEIIPDYTQPMSWLARKARDSGVIPFVSWTYHATPILINQMKENPERILAIYASLYGINKLAGINPFNESDIPQENFSMKRIPIYKNGNEVTTIKVDRWIPHNDLFSPVDFIKNLMSPGIYTPLVELPRNQNLYFGGKLTHKEGAGKYYDLAKYTASQFTPDIMDNIGGLIESKLLSKEKRTKNPVVQPRSTVQEIFNILGINSMTYNKANQAKKVANEKMK